jgi:hypothetical protein
MREGTGNQFGRSKVAQTSEEGGLDRLHMLRRRLVDTTDRVYSITPHARCLGEFPNFQVGREAYTAFLVLPCGRSA